MIASRMSSPRNRSCREHGLPTAAAVRSSRATPARRRGQACADVPRTENHRLRRRVAHPGDCIAGVDNAVGFSLIVAG
jgi:hypothetical protein